MGIPEHPNLFAPMNLSAVRSNSCAPQTSDTRVVPSSLRPTHAPGMYGLAGISRAPGCLALGRRHCLSLGVSVHSSRAKAVHQSTPTVIIGRSALLRGGVASLLERSNYKIMAVATSASDMNGALPADPHTLAVLAAGVTSENYEEMAAEVRLLRSMLSTCKIVIIADSRDTPDLQQIFALSADGFILNVDSRDILLKCLELIRLNGQGLVLDNRIAPSLAPAFHDSEPGRDSQNSGRKLDDGPHDSPFSKRERQVLSYLANGFSNKAIAHGCNITESTVKAHLKKILRKICARNRVQAAIWAIAHGYQDVSLSSEMQHTQNEVAPVSR